MFSDCMGDVCTGHLILMGWVLIRTGLSTFGIKIQAKCYKSSVGIRVLCMKQHGTQSRVYLLAVVMIKPCVSGAMMKR